MIVTKGSPFTEQNYNSGTVKGNNNFIEWYDLAAIRPAGDPPALSVCHVAAHRA